MNSNSHQLSCTSTPVQLCCLSPSEGLPVSVSLGFKEVVTVFTGYIPALKLILKTTSVSTSRQVFFKAKAVSFTF